MKTIWNDLNNLNSSTSSLEIVPTQIIHASKYINVLPQGGGRISLMQIPEGGVPLGS